MFKTLIVYYHSSLRKTVGAGWITAALLFFILAPGVVYFLMLWFEEPLAQVLMAIEPPSPRQGRVFYFDLVRLARAEVLWTGGFIIAFFVLVVYPTRESLLSVFRIRKERAPYLLMLIAITASGVALGIAEYVLETFPNSSDEYAYLFQADLLSEGKLWVRAHDLPDFFRQNNIAQYEGIRVGRFPPGWPVLLSIALSTGVAAEVVNPILALGTLAVFMVFAYKQYNAQVAVWGGVAFALTSYFLFNAASFFSHIACVLAVLLFVLCVYEYITTKSAIYGLLAGFFIGVAAVTRYYTAALIFLPFAAYLVHRLRAESVRAGVLLFLGGAPCLAFLLWYNYSITGNAFLPVTVWAYPSEQLGFVRGHTPAHGVEHLIRWTLMFVYWCSPGLLLLYVYFLWQKVRHRVERWAHPEDYAFFVLIAGYFFYYEIGGNQYGPRFLFEGFPFLVTLVVSRVLREKKKWMAAALLASILFAVIKVPYIAAREGKIVDQRQDVYALVRENNIEHAVVFVASPTSPLRPMPVDDLTRNDPMFINDVLYAVELPGINEQLMDYYPDRYFYRYTRDVNESRGRLERLR